MMLTMRRFARYDKMMIIKDLLRAMPRLIMPMPRRDAEVRAAARARARITPPIIIYSFRFLFA